MLQKYDICYYLINIFDRIMKYNNPLKNHKYNYYLTKFIVIFFIISNSNPIFSQINTTPQNSTNLKPKNNQRFENQLRYGGNFGLVFSNQFSDVLLAPNVLYEFNDYVSAGIGFQFNYLRERNNFETLVYGASLIGIANPVEFIQVSAELEQLRFNVNYEGFGKENFWNTALFLGIGLRQENFTVGIRYNLLHLNRNGYYSEPVIPFVRISF